jgi:hypothetical protein
MDVVVVETEADQQAVEAERALEIRNDRDRGAGADQQRLLAPFLGQRALGSGFMFQSSAIAAPLECSVKTALQSPGSRAVT